MDKGKPKEFRDPIHGYIAISSTYCDTFVDTPLFQRLRGIEQTSMRPLYPAAHHDRFAHSLGVFCLGDRAFHHLKTNTDPKIIKDVKSKIEKYKHTFRIACLLHDCGHAPFSHTFEEHYNRKERASKELKRLVSDRMWEDYSGQIDPPAHEIVGAIVLLKKFREEIKSPRFRYADPELAARMIMGCTHDPPKNKSEQFENCLIKLLNGKAIDVDKLDFIIRDTWASGVDNVSIDVERLLSSLVIVKRDNTLELAFAKSALSVLQNVVDGRNYLYTWIYNHHTVVYQQDLLKRAMESLGKSLGGGDEDTFYKKIFSVKSLLETTSFKGERFYLPTDGDLIYLIKKYRKNISEADELLSRSPKSVALWKTFAEFKLHFERFGKDKRTIILKKALAKLRKGEPQALKSRFLVLKARSKLASIKQGELYIRIDNETKAYVELFDENNAEDKNAGYFFIFVPEECKGKKEEYIRKLKELAN